MTHTIDVDYQVIQGPRSSIPIVKEASVRGWWLAALTLSVTWFLYVMPWMFQGLVIPWDAKDYYYPVLRFLAASGVQGEPGEWNPYLYSGFPAIADPQSWYFTLTFRIFAALDAAPTMIRMDMVELLHLLLGAIGLLLLCRRLGLRPTAATLAGFVFMFGGVAASRLQHSLMIVSYALLPWALLLLTVACESPARHRRLAAAAAFGLVAGLMAVDRDQVAFLNCLFLLTMAGWQVARRLWPRPRAALRTALELTPALLSGVVVLAIPLLLTLDFLAISTRPEIDYTTAGYASLQPAAFLTLLHADFYSALQPSGYWGPGELPWMSLSALGYDWTDMAVNHAYIGIVPLALLGTAFAIRKPYHPYRGFFIAAFITSLLYAIGAYTPIFRFIYDWVPGVDLFRRPNDAAFLVNFGFAILVGFAAHTVLARGGEARLSIFKLALPLVCLVALAAAALWIGERLDHAEDASRAVAIGVPLLLGAGILIIWGRAKLPAAGFVSALVVLSAADLLWHHAGAPFSAQPEETITAYRPDSVALAREIQSRLGNGPHRARAEIFGLGGSWQNAAMVYQLEQTLGYNPIRWSDYETATGSLQNSHLAERNLTPLFQGYDSPLARALGIKIVATGAPIESILPASATKSLTFLGQHGTAYLYQNTAALLPRVMVAPLGDPAAMTAEAGTAVTVDVTAKSAAAIGNAEIVSYRQSRILIYARLSEPGFLILHDIYHPAWRAQIDIRPLPVLRANGLFRAVALPAGEHTVVFTFDPLSGAELMEAARRVGAAYAGR